VYCCPPDTKAAAYISLVRPHLEYAAAAWDPYLVDDCKQLKKVQHWAARFVKQDYRSTALVSSPISQLRWQTLSDRRRNSRLSLMYRSLHGLAGISTSPFFLPPSHSCSWRRHILCLVLSNRSLKSRPSIHCQWCIAAAARICENGNWCLYMKLCYVAGMRELITVLSGEACTLLSVLLNVHLSAQS